MTSNNALEKKIVAALTADATSASVGALLAETEAAIAAAVEDVEQTRKKALDPIATPDANKARAMLEDAEFDRDRLIALLPRLRSRLAELRDAEYAARWRTEFEVAELNRDDLAREFADRAPKLLAELADLFARAAQYDQVCSAVDQAAPPGEHRRLGTVELVARGIDAFSRENPSLLEKTQLPDYLHGNQMLWPPRVQPALLYAPQIPVDRSANADWWRHGEERRREAHAEQARVVEYYDNRQREREAAEAAEVKARIGGP